MIMKRAFLILLSLATILPSRAQIVSTNQDLSFVYVAHDENTPVQVLIGRLKDTYNDALNYPEERAAIFYLPNGEFPVVVRVNTANDNREAFGELINELQTKRSHDIDRYTDMTRIQSILEENDIVDDYGKPRFRSVEWLYYINSTFWNLGNHEYIIASLFWIFDMEQLIKSKYLRVNIFYSGEYDVIPFNKEQPFGDKALCRSMNFIPMPY